jgi:predicted dehydrogenase
MAEKIKFGLIGCGDIALGKHYDAFINTPEAELVCVCDLVEEKAKEAMEKMGAREYYTDAQKMLNEADIDAVAITTPHPAHAMLTIMAANAGKHVMVEKPAAVNLEEMDQILAAVKENNVKLLCLPVYQTTSFKKAKALLKEDVIGQVVNIDGVTYNDIFPPEPWYLAKSAGFGASADLGIYSIATIIALFGRPEKVLSCSIKGTETVKMNDGKDYPLEQEAIAKMILFWGDKTIATVSAAWQSGNMRNTVTLCGRKGSLVLDGWGADMLCYSGTRNGHVTELTEGKEKMEFLSQNLSIVDNDERGCGKLGYDYLIEAIREDLDLTEDYEHARITLEVILKCYESVEKGEIVPMA